MYEHMLCKVEAMKILLLGEYSNVHATLADGLRKLGHQVTVASNGDFWKDYPRDIDLKRDGGVGGAMLFAARLAAALPRMRGYDVVQIINPMFLELKARRIRPIYDYLKHNNGKMVMGAFGMDYYWVHENITRKPLRYSDFNIGGQLRTDTDAMKERRDWIGTDKEKLNRYIAEDCDAIVAGLYEYWACYHPVFPSKTNFIPFPIHMRMKTGDIPCQAPCPVKVFIGISKRRSTYKGTDIMLAAAQDLQQKYPERISLQVACGIPFMKYKEMMNGADIILDQLYSYTPAMNALEAMARGVVCVGGGEPENYSILRENKLKPIINVEPNYNSVYHQLEKVVLHPECIPMLKRDGLEYVNKHHDYMKVAAQYEKLYCAI